MSKKLLYIAPHRPGRSPGQRFRFEQFIPFLEENGFKIDYSFIINKNDDKILYSKGKYLHKTLIILKSFFIRTRDLWRINNYDVVIVYREAQFLGNTFFEKQMAKRNPHLVFDFDDAIWLNDTSEANANLYWLKDPQKINKIIALSEKVIVGNSFLAEYSSRYNKNTFIVPTTISTQYYKAVKANTGDNICIGWTGSSTTIKHFEEAIPVLKKLKAKYPNRISFKLIVDIHYQNKDLDLVSTPWSKETEIEELNKIDIGIMPLPNDKWSKGKCGFKGIQYMALEKATVMSPVGVNKDIIEHGRNGFLAKGEEEWIATLSKLIESPELREKIGKAGRQTIEEKYSVNAQKDYLLSLLQD